MEVLRDHLLGVSDSGKVSGRGSGRKESRARCPASPELTRCRASASSGVELEGLAAGEAGRSLARQ